MTRPAPASVIRLARASAEKPPKTTMWTAPIRAQASIAMIVSGIIGREMATRSPARTPGAGTAVAALPPELEQRVRRLAHLGGELSVGDRAGVARLALPVVGDLVAVTGLHVP